ncbi:Acid phosphatase type 7 [Dissostichus eleginoides]|uniref:Acid phosphatase type 7 n=1 Tax=Dissostichus eleginoides TaxID=100907 RepID=A0AAD9F597_DISEL|nr:Acid phosphatase type 7 [Dissostichus eleginoides]
MNKDCDKFQSKSLASPTALVSAPSGCLRMMEPRSAEHRGLPWDACRTRCRLSSGEHLKINNINDDFSLLVTSVYALRSDAITLLGMQSLLFLSPLFRDRPLPPDKLHFLFRFNINLLEVPDICLNKRHGETCAVIIH